MIEIIPAIDISNGKCVRLFKGKKGSEIVYFEEPIKALEYWTEKGAKRIHFVDLDGAWGSDQNKDLIENLIRISYKTIKIQLGGGIRTIESAIELIEMGVDRVVIGTLAVREPKSIRILANKIGSSRIIIALDYRKKKLAVEGWTEQVDKNPFEFAQLISNLGAGAILFSSIESDGTLKGPDYKNIKKMKSSISIPLYAAGGVRDDKDIEKLDEMGIDGVIIGKALYENKIDHSIFNKF